MCINNITSLSKLNKYSVYYFCQLITIIFIAVRVCVCVCASLACVAVAMMSQIEYFADIRTFHSCRSYLLYNLYIKIKIIFINNNGDDEHALLARLLTATANLQT